MTPSKYSIIIERNFLILTTLVFLGLTFFLLKDIFTTIILSIILAYFLHPLYDYFLFKTENSKLSAVLTLTSVTVGIVVPLGLLSYFLLLNLLKIVVTYKVYIENPAVLNQFVSQFMEKFSNSSFFTNIDVSEYVNKVVVFIVDMVKDFFSSIPSMLISFFIILFITYYLLIYNKEIFKGLNNYLPLQQHKQDEIIKNIGKNLKVLFRGYFLTGAVQTIIAFIGYLVLGAPNLLLITFLTFITSLAPYVGPPIIWVPVSLYMIIIGQKIAGVTLIIYGMLVISTIDHFIRPYLMSDKDTISAPLVFIGLVGGTFAFGIIGIIIGPIIIAITSILLRFLKETYETPQEVKPEQSKPITSVKE